jgi:ubiquinone/menaquinone biosynthesis C-methylase UbiE
MDSSSAYAYEGSDLLRLGEKLKNYNNLIADLVVAQISPGDRVLDFGAGFGTLTRIVAERVGRPDCVEPDARQRWVLEDGGFGCYDRIESVPNNTYDVVYSSNVLEHIEDDVEALRQLMRTLRPNGKLILYLPAFQSLYTAVDKAIGHYRRYDIPMVTVQETYYVDVLGFLVTWIFKRIANDVSSVNPKTMELYDKLVLPMTRFIERLARPPFGKNVLAVAVRKSAPTP